MKKAFIALFLFSLQVWIVVKGIEVFDKELNPIILLAASLLIPIYFFYSILFENKNTSRPSFGKTFTGLCLGALSILLLLPSFRKLMGEFPNPENISDVIPQLKAQYLRFAHGEFPYKELDQFAWKPYPVYMPLHWLPLGLPIFLKVDVRWVGLLLLVISTALWGVFIWKRNSPILFKLLAVVLPAIVIVAFLMKRRPELAVSLETIIAAYYMILAIGLLSRNLFLITTGIILCILSRYTVVFWLPLFMLLLWKEVPKSKNIWVWLSIIAAVLFIYILPFYAKDPTILSKGLTYHNRCAVDDWRGYGVPAESPTFEYGLHFAIYFKRIFTGDAEHMVLMDRVLQSGLMLALVITGLALYRKWKNRMSFYDLSLGFLYLVLLLFYMFGPLIYPYYYIPVLMISAVMCGRVITGIK